MPDLLFELVGLLFAPDVLRESLTGLNQRETNLLDQFVGRIDRFFGCVFELDEGRNHADCDDVRSLRQRALRLRESIGSPVHRLNRMSDRAGGLVELKRDSIGETKQAAPAHRPRRSCSSRRAIATSIWTGLKSQIAGLRVTTEKKSIAPRRLMLLAIASSPTERTDFVEGAMSFWFWIADEEFFELGFGKLVDVLFEDRFLDRGPTLGRLDQILDDPFMNSGEPFLQPSSDFHPSEKCECAMNSPSFNVCGWGSVASGMSGTTVLTRSTVVVSSLTFPSRSVTGML